MGDITGAKKAARIQAAATTKAADLQANQDRLAAQAAQASTETVIAQDKAAQAASELLSKPMDDVDVVLGSNAEDGVTLDRATGRRRTIRQRFNTAPRSSGINI